MVLIFILLIVGLIVFFKMKADPKESKALYKANTTPDEKQVIRYFTASGCLRKTWSDSEFDAYVAKQIAGLHQRAIEHIGLDEDELKEIDPVSFGGFLFNNVRLSQKGEDGLWRSNKYQVSWIFFSSTHVYLYQKTIDLAFGDVSERTEEYFYKDITNFSTRQSSENIVSYDANGKEIDGSRQTVNTTSFTIVVPGDNLTCAMDKNDSNERSIQAMKTKLREKKTA
ncbi:MAG: hypothetical protein IJV22_01870 [Bacteroidales bacterium]|nr:hypothetical protein [Bacteroidales bacterium]